MAKSAKMTETVADLSEKRVNKFLKDVLERYDAIESARGRFMNTARREREQMTALYEGMASAGVSQKSARLNVKVHRALEKIRGWIADAEAEDRKMAQKLAKAQKAKHQLALFADLPKQEAPKKEKPTKRFVDELRESSALSTDTEAQGSA